MASQLSLYGPEAAAVRPPTVEQAHRYCRQFARSQYENFTVVSWLLPRRLHRPMYAVYAFCRWADDLADETGDPAESLRLLDWWRTQLLRCWSESDTQQHPVFIALRDVRKHFPLTIAPLLDLISAFQQDQHQTRYRSWSDLEDYCRRSANPVGRIVLALAAAADERTVALSDHICTGLQLVNFWQDLASDYQHGRIYVPQQAWDAAGYTSDDWDARRGGAEFRVMMHDAVGRAVERLREGLPLIELVPRWLRVDIALFVAGGLAVADKIRAIQYDLWNQRPTVSRRQKIQLLTATAVRSAVRKPVVP